MISYHPSSANAPVGSTFTRGFVEADIDDIERIGRGICQYAWSGNAWVNGHRRKENFKYSDYCVLDIDDEMHVYPLEQAKKDFCDKIHIIGTTRNHQKEKNGTVCDRYRIVVPWERRITDAALYEGNMRALRLKMEALDGSTLSAAQHFFPCAALVSLAKEGYRQEVTNDRHEQAALSDQDYSELIRLQSFHYKMLGTLPHWVERFLAQGDAEAGSRHRKTLGVALELLEHGIPVADVIRRLKAAPISRPYAPREVEHIVRYALQRMKGRLRDDQEQEV